MVWKLAVQFLFAKEHFWGRGASAADAPPPIARAGQVAYRYCGSEPFFYFYLHLLLPASKEVSHGNYRPYPVDGQRK